LTAQHRRFEIPCCLAGISLSHPPDHYYWMLFSRPRLADRPPQGILIFASACLAKAGHRERIAIGQQR
jgi:hypothetical protein